MTILIHWWSSQPTGHISLSTDSSYLSFRKNSGHDQSLPPGMGFFSRSLQDDKNDYSASHRSLEVYNCDESKIDQYINSIDTRNIEYDLLSSNCSTAVLSAISYSIYPNKKAGLVSTLARVHGDIFPKATEGVGFFDGASQAFGKGGPQIVSSALREAQRGMAKGRSPLQKIASGAGAAIAAGFTAAAAANNVVVKSPANVVRFVEALNDQ